MSYYAHHPLYAVGMLYLLVLVLRAVLSWFPIDPRSPVAAVNHWLFVITEPVVAPFRKVIPAVGAIDVSYMVAMLVVYLFSQFVLALVQV